MTSHKIPLSLLSLFLSLSLLVEATPARWTGTVTAKVKGFSPAQVWPFFEDFSNLYKIDPNVDISYALEGVYGHPGLIRFCSTHTTTKSPSGEEVITIQWLQEKLLAMDKVHHWFTYQILENNVGFTYCKSTVKVLPINGCDSYLVWTYESDPLPGQTPDYLSNYFGTNLRDMANTIEKILKSKSKN
ncbi:lachrymatory-factor synthase-like [Actinidia eriantha]|uniref:lachrymatory-factor synthase-like n=1 Tax=Actinidia eriantha TaxID=165200 RepID=UPI002582ADF7|nr:lachrymatory-factor synthase-like [Actinidia eriantha]